MTTPQKPSLDGRPDEAGGLSYPCGEAPESGHGKEIVPGVRWLRMSIVCIDGAGKAGGGYAVARLMRRRGAQNSWPRASARFVL